MPIAFLVLQALPIGRPIAARFELCTDMDLVDDRYVEISVDRRDASFSYWESIRHSCLLYILRDEDLRLLILKTDPKRVFIGEHNHIMNDRTKHKISETAEKETLGE